MNKYIYGPVLSWRVGRSLGVDLISTVEKVCSFDCVYCQLGRNPVKTKKRKIFVPTEEIIKEIKALPDDLTIDYITCSGMGEPTLAKNLGEAIKEIRLLRKEKIAVITDASLMWDKSVKEDLSLADFVMAKLDSFDQKSFEMINNPAAGIKFEDVYKGIKSFKKEYATNLAIQIMFFETNRSGLEKLAGLAFGVNPDEIQINTPLRPCGVKPLSKGEIKSIRKYFEEFGRKVHSGARIVSAYTAEYRQANIINKNGTIRRRGKK